MYELYFTVGTFGRSLTKWLTDTLTVSHTHQSYQKLLCTSVLSAWSRLDFTSLGWNSEFIVWNRWGVKSLFVTLAYICQPWRETHHCGNIVMVTPHYMRFVKITNYTLLWLHFWIVPFTFSKTLRLFLWYLLGQLLPLHYP